MARETGIVIEVNQPAAPSTIPTKGFVQRDDLTFDPNTPEFDDPTLETRSIVLKVDDKVTFEVDANNVARNLALISVIDPDLPADEGEIKEGTITGDISIVAPNTVTLKGATVTGNVNMNGGKLIMKPSDSGARSKISGGIDGKGNHRIVIYKSDVAGAIDFKNGISLTAKEATLKNVDFKNSQELSLSKTKSNGGIDGKNNNRVMITESEITGAVDVKNNTESVSISKTKTSGGIDGKNNKAISVTEVTVQQDIVLKDNQTSSVTNSVITGDLILKDNVSCASTGNTVSGENEGCL